MKIAPLLRPELILCRMAETDKASALRAMADRLAACHAGLPADAVMAALAARERAGPVSVGKGVAFPHARTEDVAEFCVVLGAAPGGIDFGAADGLPVRLIVLFVIPKKHSNLYLQAMAAFLNFFSLEDNLQRALDAETPQAMMAIFETTATAPARRVRDLMEPVPTPATAATPLGDALATMRRTGLASLPVVNGDGALVGALHARTLLRLAARCALSVVADTVTLAEAPPVDRYVAEHAAVPIGEIAGLVVDGTLPVVQQDDSAAAAAVRLARSGADAAFVLDRARPVGVLRAVSLLGGHDGPRP